MSPRARAVRLVVLLLASGAVTDRAWGTPSVVREERLVLHVDLLASGGERAGPAGTRLLEIDPRDGGRLETEIDWPSARSPSRLRVEARGRPGPPDEASDVAIETAFSPRGERAVHARRSLRLRDGATSLVEVYGEGDRRLVLAVRAERVERPFIREGPTVGRPVRFLLEIVRVEGERSIALESNRMDTFVGEGVEYAFQRGEGASLESVRLRLEPVRLEGAVAHLEVEVTGTLPGTPNRIVLSRRQSLVTTRGATSSLVVAAGEPPSGYEFRLTPDF